MEFQSFNFIQTMLVKMILRQMSSRVLVSGGSGLQLQMKNLTVPNVDGSLSVLVRSLTLTNVKLRDPIKYCSIKELKVNQELSQMKLDNTQHLDNCVDHILKKDIQVPAVTLMMDKMIQKFTHFKKHSNIPDEVKLKRWSPGDDQLIVDNMDDLMTGIGQKKNKDAVLVIIFTPSSSTLHQRKTNIIGCSLGQGLQDLRLPCEIFQRAKRLFYEDLYKRVVYTERADKQILEYMANEAKTDRTPYASLSKMLGYSADSIRIRYNRILKHGCKILGAYTDEENRVIMLTLFQKNKNAQNQYYVQDDIVWENLSKKLNRTPHNIYKHWENVIRPSILMFENGMENVDLRPILIDYFVANGIKFRSEIKWSEVMKDERFSGVTTAHFLQMKYKGLVYSVKRANPGIKNNEVTSEALQSYLAGSKSKYKVKTKLLEDYVTIKNAL